MTALRVVVLILPFCVAGADSALLVLGMLSQGGSLHPRRWLVITWGSMMGAVAMSLLLAGGLEAIQTTVIVLDVPFLLVMMPVCCSLVQQLGAEPVVSTVPPPSAVKSIIACRTHWGPSGRARSPASRKASSRWRSIANG